MRVKLVWGLCALLFVVAVSIAVPAVAANQKTSQPGNAVNGKLVYVKFCGKCHTLSDAGARGTLGNNLDHVDITFSQVYDVAKYVSSVSKKIGNTPCTSIG